MDASIVYIFAILFIVVAINLFFVAKRFRSGDKRSRKGRAAMEEAKQAIWRDKEIARRIAREQEDALERVQLRNETLALYDEVRRRASARESEGALISSKDWEHMNAEDAERFR